MESNHSKRQVAPSRKSEEQTTSRGGGGGSGSLAKRKRKKNRNQLKLIENETMTEKEEEEEKELQLSVTYKQIEERAKQAHEPPEKISQSSAKILAAPIGRPSCHRRQGVKVTSSTEERRRFLFSVKQMRPPRRKCNSERARLSSAQFVLAIIINIIIIIITTTIYQVSIISAATGGEQQARQVAVINGGGLPESFSSVAELGGAQDFFNKNENENENEKEEGELLASSEAFVSRTTRQLTGSGDSTTTATTTTNGDEATSAGDDFNLPYDYHASMPVITKRELANAIKQASANMEKQLRALEEKEEADEEAGAIRSESETATGDNDIVFSSSLSEGAGTTNWLASSMFHKPVPLLDERLLNQTRQALISEEATRLLARQFKLSRVQTTRGLPLISVEQTQLGRQCARPARSHNCIPGRYRSLTGHCNNVQQADWGAAQTPLVRYAPARYADNISRPPRSSSSGSSSVASNELLPSARRVSLALHEVATGATPLGAQPAPHSHMTTMLSFFGQFLFHDLAFVPQFNNYKSTINKCCRQQLVGAPSSSSQQQQHPECMPIVLSAGAPTAASGGRSTEPFCLDYVRSVPAIRNGCNLGPRDQLNLVSSFLDGSAIYGSSEAQMRALRTFTGGRLRSQRPGAQRTEQTSTQQLQQSSVSLELLPQIKWQTQAQGGRGVNGSVAADSHWLATARDCYQMAVTRRKRQQRASQPEVADMMQQMHLSCFQAGDTRVNENLGLTLMHTIWMREHNLIADKLASLNRHWRDERLFEEARRIVVAELQQITYSEFLPSILGEEVMQRFNLSILSQGYSQAYEPALNPGVSNELATAVFPFILSTIPGALERYSERLEMLGATSLADTFMDASDLFKRNKFAQYLTGMMSQSAMEPALGLIPMTMEHTSGGSLAGVAVTGSSGSSAQLVGAATNSSSLSAKAPQLDVVALTIQQGRDHGLRSYLYWRRVCQLRPLIKSWPDLELVMPRELVERLRQVYATPEQLDLYLALLETPAPGATLGPTFVCLLARQFYSLKHGDRYWFENDLPGVAFTPGQLDELRQTSLAKVLCRNSQASISFIQPAPMLASDPFLNAYQYCTNKAMTDDLDLNKWRQTVTSAKQLVDEELLASGSGDYLPQHEEFGHARALQRGKRLIKQNAKLIASTLGESRGKLDQVSRQERARLKAGMAAKVRARRHARGTATNPHAHHATGAGYRYLPRLKRQALSIHNQSIIFELATNEVVRSLVRQGKDRERAQSLQADIRDFLYSLESIQLDNLLDNSASNERLEQLIAASNGAFLTDDQRQRLASANDPLLATSGDPLASEIASGGNAGARSSSVSMNCQDDDRAYPCDHTTPFRTITGWCNNLLQPKFGQSFTQHDRILPSAYDDGLSRPRELSVTLVKSQNSRNLEEEGGALAERARLPSARLISTTMHDDRSQVHVRYSLALMQFGQFGVDHDLTRTPFSVALDGSLLDCSSCDSRETIHRDCLPIEIPDDDAFYQSAEARRFAITERNSKKFKKCLHFVRSLNGQPALGPRQQLNALTSYLDASEIYGSDNCEAKSLRAFSGGRLNSSSYPANAARSQSLSYTPREILPTTRLNPECATPSGLCFHAGDQRASEQPGLTAIHTIFLRLHNSIVDQLAIINRHWSDEKLYQHGRRIVGAILQRITYNEFAPRLLGLDYMSKFDLMLKQVGYSNNYDDSCSASILTEFASAAFRMGHSLIRPAFPLLNKSYKMSGAGGSGQKASSSFQLRLAFFNSHRILSEPQLIDSILRGIVSTPIESLDNSITDELTNHLFEKPREPFSGMDLISLNIQRARDHGIAGYNRYRQKCNLTRARTFEDLSAEIPARLIKRLANLYASVDDIDLFTGGLSETAVHGGIIGPTFGCIIGMQFARLKKCDRFWHETSDPFVRFSAPQLAELRKMTLAKVICSQSDLIDTIQRNAMDVPDNYLNPRVPCSSLPAMDLSVWRENTKSCQVVVVGVGSSSGANSNNNNNNNKIRIELGASKRVSPCRSCTCTLEGPVCRTAKVNCLKMMQRAAAAASATSATSGGMLSQIMADKSCLVQCAWALDMQL